jgi:hypothetical protein
VQLICENKEKKKKAAAATTRFGHYRWGVS